MRGAGAKPESDMMLGRVLVFLPGASANPQNNISVFIKERKGDISSPPLFYHPPLCRPLYEGVEGKGLVT